MIGKSVYKNIQSYSNRNYNFVDIQPSLIEGLSPVILTIMGLGTLLICSNIDENIFINKKNAAHFIRNNFISLNEKLNFALENKKLIKDLAGRSQEDIKKRFMWELKTNQFIDIFNNKE